MWRTNCTLLKVFHFIPVLYSDSIISLYSPGNRKISLLPLFFFCLPYPSKYHVLFHNKVNYLTFTKIHLPWNSLPPPPSPHTHTQTHKSHSWLSMRKEILSLWPNPLRFIPLNNCIVSIKHFVTTATLTQLHVQVNEGGSTSSMFPRMKQSTLLILFSRRSASSRDFLQLM